MNFEQNGSCDQKMLVLKYFKIYIHNFIFYSRNRKQRTAGLREKYTPISDSILAKSLGGDQVSTLDPTSSLASVVPGTATGIFF